MSSTRRNTALHSAAGSGNVAAARRLLAAGAEIEAIGKGGWTPLHVATFKGHLEVVELLLAAGARVHESTLAFAREYSYDAILAKLTSAQALQQTTDATNDGQ